jgi:hypothetical protein
MSRHTLTDHQLELANRTVSATVVHVKVVLKLCGAQDRSTRSELDFVRKVPGALSGDTSLNRHQNRFAKPVATLPVLTPFLLRFVKPRRNLCNFYRIRDVFANWQCSVVLSEATSLVSAPIVRAQPRDESVRSPDAILYLLPCCANW